MVGVETLVGIECHRLEGIGTRLATLNTGFAELVEDALCAGGSEKLDVDGTAPVVQFLVFLVVVVGKETDLRVVQISVVSLDREDGKCHFSGVEDIRLGGADR